MHEEVSVEEPEREGYDSRASGAGVAGNKRRYVAESIILSPSACELIIVILIVGSGESPSPEPTQKPKLAEDETIINPYYMRQLLQYGIRLGQQQNSKDLSPEDLLREATVRLLHVVFPYLSID